MSEKKGTSTIEVKKVDDASSVDTIPQNESFEDPSVITRLFYAQRSLEKHIAECQNEKYFGSLNRAVYKTLKIDSLEAKSDDYPTWVNDDL